MEIKHNSTHLSYMCVSWKHATSDYTIHECHSEFQNACFEIISKVRMTSTGPIHSKNTSPFLGTFNNSHLNIYKVQKLSLAQPALHDFSPCLASISSSTPPDAHAANVLNYVQFSTYATLLGMLFPPVDYLTPVSMLALPLVLQDPLRSASISFLAAFPSSIIDRFFTFASAAHDITCYHTSVSIITNLNLCCP